LQIGIAPESLDRFKAKTRELWSGRQSKTSNQLRDAWRSYIRGWWEYFQLAEERKPVARLEGWVRRHIQKHFWLRWHHRKGRERHLRHLGIRGPLLNLNSEVENRCSA